MFPCNVQRSRVYCKMPKDCSGFMVGDSFDEWTPCHCPKCGGFLPQYFPTDGSQFKCKKCGAILETIPNMQDAVENGMLEDLKEDIEEGEWNQDDIDEAVMEGYGGKICLVPDYAVKKE